MWPVQIKKNKFKIHIIVYHMQATSLNSNMLHDFKNPSGITTNNQNHL
jgi:hypothetical protein